MERQQLLMPWWDIIAYIEEITRQTPRKGEKQGWSYPIQQVVEGAAVRVTIEKRVNNLDLWVIFENVNGVWMNRWDTYNLPRHFNYVFDLHFLRDSITSTLNIYIKICWYSQYTLVFSTQTIHFRISNEVVIMINGRFLFYILTLCIMVESRELDIVTPNKNNPTLHFCCLISGNLMS